jgi:N-acetylmuramoyl-L-alanine amidase
MGNVIISVAHSDITPHQAKIEKIGLREYDVSTKQSVIVASLLAGYGHHVELFDCKNSHVAEYKRLKPHIVNNTAPPDKKPGEWDLAIEIHHDAIAIPSVQYGHCIYYNSPRNRRSRRAACLIAAELADVTPWKSKGGTSHHRFDRDRMWFITKTKCPAVIPEAGFFTGPGAVEFYSDPDNIHREGIAIGEGVNRYLEK